MRNLVPLLYHYGDMTASNLTENFRVIAIIDTHHKDKPTTYVNIRVAFRKDRNKNIDIPVYFENGVRMKVIPSSFKEGIVTKGYYDEKEMIRINDRIAAVWGKVKGYVAPKTKITKQQIEEHVYSKEFLQIHKKARTRQLTVSVAKKMPSPYFIELRKKYGKRKMTTINSIINKDGFEEDQFEDVIIDPLDVNDPEFPKYFPFDLYEKFKAEWLRSKGETKFSDADAWHLNEYIRFKCNMTFYTQTEDVTIVQPVLDEFENTYQRKFAPERKVHPVTIDGKKVRGGDVERVLNLKKDFEYRNHPTEKIYTEEKFDKANILHVFGSVYFDTLKNQQNERVVIRVFDYVANTNASTHIKDFNIKWANSFFEWIKEKGYIDMSAKMFDPLKYNKNDFKNATRKQYKAAGLKKQIVSFNVVAKHLHAKGLLPSIDHTKVLKVSVEDGQRNTHYLLLNEFESLLSLDFKSSKLEEYRAIFNDLKEKGTIKGTFKNDVSIESLKLHRDVFAFQVMIGGLRGLPEYQTVELIDYDNKGKVFRFLQEKIQKSKENKRHILNPLNKYTKELLIRYKGTLPHIKSAEVLNGYLKVIAHIANLDRQVEKGMTIKDNISQYWARKSFGNILFSKRVSEDQIALFTGHETRKSELGKSYLDLQNVTLKRDIYQSIGF